MLPAERLSGMGLRVCLTLGALLLLGACTSLLPRSSETTQAHWQSFSQAKDVYDRIEPHHTSLANLRDLGIDPDTTENIRILSYLDVQQRFLSNQSLQLSDLDPDVRICLQAHAGCSGLDIQPKALERRRVGNVVLDVLDFRRETVESGWSFSALILLKDDTVLYKTWGGSPNIRVMEKRSKPLGPLQDLGDFAGQRAQSALPL